MKGFSHGGWTGHAAWVAKGKIIVSTGADSVVRSWTAKGAPLHVLKTPEYRGCCGVPASSVIAAFNGGSADLTLWDAASGKVLHTLAGHQRAAKKNRSGANVSCAAMSPDGSMAVSGGYDNCVRFWEVKSGAAGKHLQLPSLVCSVAFSADGALVAVGLFPHVVVVIDVKTGKKVAEAKASKKAVTDRKSVV